MATYAEADGLAFTSLLPPLSFALLPLPGDVVRARLELATAALGLLREHAGAVHPTPHPAALARAGDGAPPPSPACPSPDRQEPADGA